MRENKGTYQNKGTFASCKGSAKDLQTVSIPLHPVVIVLYLVATVYNLLRSFFNFPATTDNLSFSLPLYKVCVNYLHQVDSNISTTEKTLSADTIGIYISAVTGRTIVYGRTDTI